ncbi:MAG: tRNA pseudouridine synthase A [Treponema sp.]|jgi:tRNA pseudouridine38-40 synthase|nr:tRNA pseudouridine synthase A [Treponema sp.]
MISLGSAGLGLRNIKLIVAYDGTAYSGWQRQTIRLRRDRNRKDPAAGQGRTIQGEIETVLEKIHRHPVVLTGSGRTDAGVHARGQTANFFTDIQNMAALRFVPALNGLLPWDIRILDAREAPPSFHARFDARSRLYRYFFVPRRRALPWELRYALPLCRRPDLALLNRYCRFLRGEMDCRIFASSGEAARSRYIYGASFFAEGDRIVFEIRANAFLWKMVRSAAGTLLFYGDKGLDPREVRERILSGKRELAGPTLPPAGLFLWHIAY